jgi:hypothetical protein
MRATPDFRPPPVAEPSKARASSDGKLPLLSPVPIPGISELMSPSLDEDARG